jgi:SAM-dependent methyltransferase
MGEAPAGGRFESAYFAAFYRDYAAQNPGRKLDFYRRVIERWAPPPTDGGPRSLLDAGCGLGRFLSHLEAGGGWRLHGTDVSRFAIEENRQRLPGVDLRIAAATDRPYPAASFDVVTAFDVLEHVPELDAAGDALASMLRPGGLFVLVVPVYDGASGPLIRLLDRDPTHLHTWPRRDWLDWVAGRFSLLEWLGMLRYLLPGGLYLHLPTRRLRRHTPAILVAARRTA